MAVGAGERAAIRSAASCAWARPAAARWRPGARLGMTFPVVGVCPCRTRNTTVGLGALLVRARDRAALATLRARVERAVWTPVRGGTTAHRRLERWFPSTRRRGG